jgi:hypothetical protein
LLGYCLATLSIILIFSKKSIPFLKKFYFFYFFKYLILYIENFLFMVYNIMKFSFKQ